MQDTSFSKNDRKCLAESIARAVEKIGKSRQQVRFSREVCDDDNALFGAPGSNRRVQSSRLFSGLKKRTITSYMSLLRKSQIEVGKGTLAELKEHEKKTKEKDSDSSDASDASDHSDGLGSSDGSHTDDVGDSVDDLVDAVNGISLQPPVAPSSVNKTSVRAPPSTAAIHKPPLQRNTVHMNLDGMSTPSKDQLLPNRVETPQRAFGPPSFASPAPSFASPGMSARGLGEANVGNDALASLFANAQDGTKENPYKIPVNTRFPERNGPFLIDHVNDVAVKNANFSGYHIRVPTSLHDIKEWTATIPVSAPSLSERAIMIRGPSTSGWHRDAERYYAGDEDCGTAKNALGSTIASIQASQERQFSYWLVIFPINVRFDHTVFPRLIDNTIVTHLSLQRASEGTTELGRVTYGASVYWKVALQGGRLNSVPKPTAMAKYLELFDEEDGNGAGA